MADSSIAHAQSSLSRKVTALPFADMANAVDGDQSCFEVEISAPLSPTENSGLLALLVLSSKDKGEKDDFVAGNLSPGVQSHQIAGIAVNSCSLKSMSYCETICAAPCDAMQVIKESSSSGAPEMRAIQKGDCAIVIGEGDCAIVIGEGDCLFGGGNGKPKESSGSVVPEMRATRKDVTGFNVLRAAPGKLFEKIDAVRDDFRCSLDIELIDDTAVIGIELETAHRKNVRKEQPKKERKPRRKSRAAKKNSDENKNTSNFRVSTGMSTGYKRKEKAKKMVYSRKAMETLRYWNLKGQRKLWHRIYNLFSPIMKTEYEELGCSMNQNKQSGFISDTNRAPPVLGMAAAKGGCLDDYMRQDDFQRFLWGRRNFV